VDGENIPQRDEALPVISTGRIADIAEIAVIARDRKSKTLPLINADKHGSENQNLTAEKIIDDTRRHSGHFQK
jgi:hypothetical protein